MSEMTKNMGTKGMLVYNRLKTDILDNKYPPGTDMVERKLCDIYEVSRSTIRHALSALCAEGILENKQGKGIAVPEYRIEDILEVYDLVGVLQVYAIETSLSSYTSDHDKKLKEINEKAKEYLDKGDLAERMNWDIMFHEAIVDFAHNKHLKMLFELMVNHKRRFDVTSFDDPEHAKETLEQHIKIYEALCKRDVEAAVKEMNDHTDYIKKYYIDKLINKRHNIS